MKSFSSQAFTLIELIVVMTIIGIISLWAYLPYSHHQKKTIVSQAAKELSQSLTEARNLAVHGRASGSGNLHVWLFFEDTSTLLYYGYPLTMTGSFDDAELLKTKKLPRGATLSGSLVWVEYFFEAISWELLKREILPDWSFASKSLDTIEVFEVSYLGATEESLQWKVNYYTKSHISDF